MTEKFDCEMFRNNRCLGCVGLGEKDWCGKYYCKTYNRLKKEKIYDYKNTIIGKK